MKHASNSEMPHELVHNIPIDRKVGAESSCDLHLMQYPASIFKSTPFLENNIPISQYPHQPWMHVEQKELQVDGTELTN